LELALEVNELATRGTTLGLHYDLSSCHEAKDNGNCYSGKEAQGKGTGAVPQQSSTDEICGNRGHGERNLND
jgi:hypothetical protein